MYQEKVYGGVWTVITKEFMLFYVSYKKYENAEVKKCSPNTFFC